MAFVYRNREGVAFYLHERPSRLRNGREQRNYFFNRTRTGALAAPPAGYAVAEVEETGLPVLRKAAEPAE
jgi:hypothetical protein